MTNLFWTGFATGAGTAAFVILIAIIVIIVAANKALPDDDDDPDRVEAETPAEENEGWENP